MYKIGVVGDKDSILGFKALGMSVFPVTSAIEAQETIDKIASMQYAVIYITEQFAKDIVSTIEKYKDQRLPAIIPIPSNQGPLGIGMMNVKKSVERAVGADILFKDE
ncbi:MAG TPA: V-type ATP synthase subunit F [Acetivibrio sp.]|uniref:V-type ATP synthase subunit F n=1 Tax=Acetivibrio sp. TaxID=1872092 RepID=UPI002CC32204|nr:V-type ATP synthase subunit F [Acetivibrio sp.]HOM03128.1 V-type ATP synthase subunit F [Acetivibrio sp.]